MKGKELEEIVLVRLRAERDRGRCSVGRYGVQASMRRDERGVMVWSPMQSYPDLEGILPPLGRQFVFDCKVCGQASLQINDEHFAARQLRHLLERDEFGAICFLLIHFSARVLKTRTDDPETWAFPVSRQHTFWQAADRGEMRSISREACREYGVQVEWNTLPGGRTPRPDVLSAILDLAKMKDAMEKYVPKGGWLPRSHEKTSAR